MLNEETAKLFRLHRLPKGGPTFHFGRWGTIDLSKLTPKQAETLVQQGFPFLRKREKKRTKGQSEEKGEQ